MSSRARAGVLFSTRDDLELVREAERLGFESIWAAEGQGKTAFGKLERWATVTDEVQLATGIVNVFSRTPATTAQALATLDDHSDGRAILGLGVAHPGVVEAFHGTDFDRPIARLAEYIRLVRRYLEGEPSAFDGEFYTPERTSFWEAFEPVRSDIPIYNAALGPSNVRLTGELADGWLPNLYPREAFDQASEWLETGLERGDRNIDDIDIAMYVLVSVDDDPAVARDAAAAHVATYFRDIPGYYDRVASEAGFESMIERVRAASSAEAATAVVEDEFLEQVAVIGDETAVRTRLAELRRAGVNLPIVRAPIGADRDSVKQLLETTQPT
ncbi:LLM class flavin-dependent oxidoreductase [Natronorubrum texcoconense]|uniref:Flavin-dependent oxidoreductase, luciferase family (Includes alkanesulfonate monooxygenase SsuD and methylene tetrahydromethanopterin reductase) n=1 Tax=Natronorubrum texcoconense TaxID=1095776 RepID=A0A1G9D2C7_9EURY|nr:LLM class flavin-dependent oxidoreductase [Natronorubrum texcoconense]SDK58037.1 Flavin-dependent oxidoreductase, luciferase family (includes alkanesulfonate monooxygenase SsuD and methylene tetrahydromethanopterin reductase) [Natronorubrum texcoconense]